MMEEGVYGGGKAGAPFDPLTFVQRPQVILRAVSWVRTGQWCEKPRVLCLLLDLVDA
ncbi:Synaptogyrin-3 [Portunus trituberculatus]|uniref:Synaptogyrin-3 n=1 Tax=Portunus trituberculatus TaxID=210409 RepID=A0A5B7KAA5_PORTR|nr:Synaptogyrin-3 [Portunus trituberculatus]